MDARRLASPTADAVYASAVPGREHDAGGIVGRALAGVNAWTILLGFLLIVVAYDQCQFSGRSLERPYWINPLTVRATVQYVWNKGSIAGPSLKIPFMGPFLESVYPEFERYKAKWASGELSCVSVFHKSVTRMAGMASAPLLTGPRADSSSSPRHATWPARC